MRFHQRLRELKGDMSEAALADAAGLPYATVHNYILGRRSPAFGAVVKLARALGTTCETFADCEDLLESDGRSVESKTRVRKPLVGTSAPPGKPSGKAAAGKRPRKLQG